MNRVLTADKPQCLKFLGYFQNLPICHDDILRLWTPRLFANYTDKPGQNDISIYLRCVPRHYHFNDRHFYETILNHTIFDRVWLFYAPECPTRLGNDPSRDGLVASVIRLLIENFNATRWPTSTDPDDTSQLLYDLSALAQSKKLILPLSSWAQWAGMFSNATEIHVNYLLHPTMPNMPQYYYHYEKERKFFGRWNSSNNDVDFELDNPLNNEITHVFDINTQMSMALERKSKLPLNNPNIYTNKNEIILKNKIEEPQIKTIDNYVFKTPNSSRNSNDFDKNYIVKNCNVKNN
jgi:hypothetical protein